MTRPCIFYAPGAAGTLLPRTRPNLQRRCGYGQGTIRSALTVGADDQLGHALRVVLPNGAEAIGVRLAAASCVD